MEAFSALPGFREEDAILFQTKLAGVGKLLSNIEPVSAFGRIMSIAGLPDLTAAARLGKLDLKALLACRDTDEARAFRDWLSRSDELSDVELKQLVTGIGRRLSRAVCGVPGRVIRVLVGTALTMPFTDPATSVGAGAALGLLDTVLWDAVLPKPGPWSFVDMSF